MALDQLLAVLHREAETEVDAVLASARAEAAGIRERCAGDLAERKRQDQEALEAEQKAAVESALVAARRSARRDELLAREHLLDRILAAARRRFGDAVDSPALRDAIPTLVVQALECLANRSATIRAHPALTDLVARHAGTHPGVRVSADPSVGTGFRLTSDDGTLAIDATLEDRMTRLDQRLRQQVLARLERAV